MNDRDDLTDLTLLHYASKSGASECTSWYMACQRSWGVGGVRVKKEVYRVERGGGGEPLGWKICRWQVISEAL